MADIWALAPAPSVTLTASAKPFRQPARDSTDCAEAPSGGEVSAVMTKMPARSRLSSRPMDLVPAAFECVTSGKAALLHQLLQPGVVEFGLEFCCGTGRLGLEIVAAGNRIGPAPFGEI